MRTDENLLEDISRKLSALLYLHFKQSELSKVEGIQILAGLGFPNGDIAGVLGTTKGTVEVTKARLSKRK